MGLIGIVLLVILVISAVLLVLVVLVQDEQGEGIGGIFGGGSNTAFGSRSGNVLTRFHRGSRGSLPGVLLRALPGSTGPPPRATSSARRASRR